MHTTLGEMLNDSPCSFQFSYQKYWDTSKVRAALKVGLMDNTREGQKHHIQICENLILMMEKAEGFPSSARRVCQQPVWDMSQVGSILHEPYAANSSGPAGPTLAGTEPKAILAAGVPTLGSSQGCGPDHNHSFHLVSSFTLSCQHLLPNYVCASMCCRRPPPHPSFPPEIRAYYRNQTHGDKNSR